jgi:hypothetical protein
VIYGLETLSSSSAELQQISDSFSGFWGLLGSRAAEGENGAVTADLEASMLFSYYGSFVFHMTLHLLCKLV